MLLPMPIFVLGQCIVGYGFAQTSIGGVTRALGRTRTCDLLIRSPVDLDVEVYSEAASALVTPHSRPRCVTQRG
jgi:hypothetical protein